VLARFSSREFAGFSAPNRLERVVNKNSLDPRDRGNLADDIRRMRDFRELRNRGGEWR